MLKIQQAINLVRKINSDDSNDYSISQKITPDDYSIRLDRKRRPDDSNDFGQGISM
jgi:hypothetical protein